MAHAHSHEGENYYLDQLCTIGVCGALGGVAIMMYVQGMLQYILVKQFHLWVLLGGIALLVLVLVRAVALWFSAGRVSHAHNHNHDHDHAHHHHDHGHDHDHGDHQHEHEHCHEHGDCGHDHDHNDHGHSHAFSPWRYAVMLLPIMLFLLNMPNAGFSNDYLAKQLRGDQFADASVVQLERKGNGVMGLYFSELSSWAQSERTRREYQGFVGKLKGQFYPTNVERVFTLVRFKMICCATDAVPAKVMMVLANDKQSLASIKDLAWVEVEGQIQFRERPDQKGVFIPVLQVASLDDIRPVDPDPSPFIQ